MRFMPALAIALVASVGLTVSPLVAAKKEKAEEQAKPKYSDAFIKAAQPLDKAAKAKDFVTLKAGLDGAASVASTPDDMFLLNMFRYQVATGTNDQTLQKQAVNGMLESGKADPVLALQLEGIAGQFALQAGEVDSAIVHLEKATTSPTAQPELKYLLAEAFFSKAVKIGGGKATPESQPVFAKGLGHLQAAIDGLKAAGKPVPANYYTRGTDIARAVGSPVGAQFALAGVKEGGNPQSWNALLSAYQDSHRALTRGELLDIFRLMATANALRGPNEYAEYADNASKGGLVGEVKAVIDSGRASGKLQPTQLSDIYQLASGQIARDRASLPAAEASAAKAADGKVAASTASAYLGYGDYAKAATLYRLALQKGGVDANEVNTRLGIALAKSGDAAGATAAFAAITTPGARKDIAEFWTIWVNGKGT